MTHEEYMREALDLAKKGMGFTSPNPMVGAVIVRNGEIIGKGYHKKYGDLHAERSAFAYCDANSIDCTGADMYVTLEPCCHYGKQPPCTEAVIAHGIKRVFIGSSDPNPLVAGKGTQILRDHDIEVTEGILRAECDELNEIFFHFITTGMPFVTMKYAMTMDGKIACYTGNSKWITGETSRAHVQKERLRHSAIMVGVGTVLADDPLLTCRLENGHGPLRIICDSSLRTPLCSNIIKTANEVPTVIATISDDIERISLYEAEGCRIIKTSPKDDHVDLYELMKTLGSEKVDSVLLEGGGEMNWSALNAGIVSKVQAYIAPKLFGGSGKTPVSGFGVPAPDNAFMLENSRIVNIGNDIMIESRVKKCSRE
ncbi:MAG: bifunctional diaminohydroxyphosphoribosylaminopyrimidine deaminase/5-amino-6-(5-phosphoribosylamino)uracil reductase RibD [Ruminococcus sp.]|uniref:bifunctional diaminohydroxyphosphoribosylaminopyrimidine deaminase/5-amino-6-(5-phosphoribosylamino)uracil reductase RibD n=1 Tax=Ruminococcus sp. TaxID=41978 RepID=UPI0025E26195|nr:bifunctional diaminohydroxyphosphoribosylaminopyrimidine deaminase/5-amino-6-(5-phosphoribosylamino)uracil reductase RibD [Ruminococcus sp.]MCR5601222.1 bifunctional diaminohydroxyphosphoribosylaminopyrimidine deaminase/5-amino-6-(5-phosphoribosylamino)uracil reductase RibD [Ruminococcus sp.]